MKQLLTGICVAAGAVLLGGTAPAASAEGEVRIVVEEPRPGQVVRARLDMAPI